MMWMMIAAQASVMITPPPPAPPPPAMGTGIMPVTVGATTLPHGPVPNMPILWIKAADYPPGAIINGDNGTTGFTLAVKASGEVSGCVVTESSGSLVLDRTTCELLRQRAVFAPALDGAGRPVAGTYSSKTRWVLPPPASLPQAADFAVTYVVETDGRTSGCSLVRATGTLAWRARDGAMLCPLRMREPFRDAQGNPVRREVRIVQSTIITPLP